MERVARTIYIPEPLAQKIDELAKVQNATISRTIENILRKEVSVIPASHENRSE
jgi:hypothetical protein